MDQIEGLPPCPFFLNIVYLKEAVRGHPGDWRREKVHSANGSYFLVNFQTS
jgi:hypothetical protein